MSAKLSKSEYAKRKLVEEQRKEGILPAEKDEHGRDINPHIPTYISNAPWYIYHDTPTLSHQRYTAPDPDSTTKWYTNKGKKDTSTAATKFKKGACENCGSMTHKKKDCMERPRKKGAKHTGEDIQPDEYIQKVDLSFEAKRDRWNGYNANEQLALIKEAELIEAQRAKNRSEMAARKLANGESLDDEDGSDDDDDDDDEKYAEETDMPGQKVDQKNRTTVRNLRIREDTAKYLLNLDVNSAYYDPKTRSMRQNPNTDKNDADLLFKGDNFERVSGAAVDMAKRQVFSWEAAKHNVNIHLNANPSQAELLYREYQKNKANLGSVAKESILEKYGGESHLQAPPKELLLAATETYVEYDRTGSIVKGQEAPKVRSIYPEDVYNGNHTTVWGSHYRNGQWGYACCWNTVRGSYCTGEQGKQAILGSEQVMKRRMDELEEEKEESSNIKAVKKIKPNTAATQISNKSTFDGMVNGVTEDEFEEYRRKKVLSEDPMAKYLESST